MGLDRGLNEDLSLDVLIYPPAGHSLTTRGTPFAMKADTLLSEPSAARESSIQPVLDGYGLELTPDGEFVRWSASNRRHPRNWGASRKTYDCSLIIFLDLFT